MIFPLCLVLGDAETCVEVDSYSSMCYLQNRSAPICHNNTCISCLEMSANAPHWNADAQECDSCDGLSYYFSENKCVETCPTTAPVSVNRICRTCYEVSWRKPKWTGSTCDYCHDSFWDGEKCVTTCPSTAPNNYAGVCYSCSSSLYFNVESNRCVPKCSDPLPVANKNRVCVTCLELYPNSPIW